MVNLPANNRTQLYDTHTALKARILEFGGWDMPIQYSGILAETEAVRTRTGIFDVSHMGRVYISGLDATALVNALVSSPILNMDILQARYGLMCTGNAGIIDDLILYKISEDNYLLIPNAGNREFVLQWIHSTNEQLFSNSVTITDKTLETTMLAIQGPMSESLLQPLITLTSVDNLSDIRFFRASHGNIMGSTVFIGRTGYTGEDGFEIITDNANAKQTWDTLVNAGAEPCGLGARDVLRLEAALPLYGHELNINTSPIEAGLQRFVKKKTSFIGSQIVHQQLEHGTTKTLIGVTVAGKSAPRQGYPIMQRGTQIGEITSGSFSPSLGISIALGYVSTVQYKEGAELELDIRGRIIPASLASTPFYKRGN